MSDVDVLKVILLIIYGAIQVFVLLLEDLIKYMWYYSWFAEGFGGTLGAAKLVTYHAVW